MQDYYDLANYRDELEDILADWEGYLDDMEDARDFDGEDCIDGEEYLDDVNEWLDDWWDYLDDLNAELEELLMEQWEDYLDELLSDIDNFDELFEEMLDAIDGLIDSLWDSMGDEEKIKYCRSGVLPDAIYVAVLDMLGDLADVWVEFDEISSDLLDAFWEGADFYQDALADTINPSAITGSSRQSTGSASGSFGAAQNFLRMNNGLLRLYDSAGAAADKQNEKLAKLF